MFDSGADSYAFANKLSTEQLKANRPMLELEDTKVNTNPNDLAGVPDRFGLASSLESSEQEVASTNLHEAVRSSEHQMILAAIQTTESRMEAAAKLGISPRTLRYKLAKLKAENGNMAWAA